MHIGRFAPRVKPFWLSAGLTQPEWAPIYIRPQGLMIWQTHSAYFGDDPWGEGVVDLEALTITWSAVAELFYGPVSWSVVQSREISPTPIVITTTFEDLDGGRIVQTFRPPPEAWNWSFTFASTAPNTPQIATAPMQYWLYDWWEVKRYY